MHPLPAKPTFAQFWPYYLGEHSLPITRHVHVVGTLLYLSLLGTAIVTMRPILIAGCPVIAYGFAWFAHFFLEKNRPATFKHPLLSLWGDHVMCWHAIAGTLPAELKKYGIEPKGSVATPTA